MGLRETGVQDDSQVRVLSACPAHGAAINQNGGTAMRMHFSGGGGGGRVESPRQTLKSAQKLSWEFNWILLRHLHS